MAAPKAEAPPAKGEATPTVITPAAPAKKGGIGAWIPVIAAVLLAPVATWATVEFVLLPRLQKKIAAAATEEPGAEPAGHAAEAPAHGSKPGKEGKAGGKESAGGPGTYEFQNVVVNLAGTMGTRYLKTSFIVTAAPNADIRGLFEGAKPKLTDVTLNVLSSLTLADLEEPGAKNVIREKLVMAYNQALGKKVADQVYFSDFVIQ
ncbi:MAG: flagellar basal body-associated FliL family protein [Verrucomicrobia bacterium]|nr:flagellar basal body-associated FliL family protein [Verrucomicrobiota bacterium]